MMKFPDNFCYFNTDGNNKSFRVVDLQIDNTFILGDHIFAAAKKKELEEAFVLAKGREKLIFHTSIKFYKGYMRLVDDNSFFFTEER